MPNSLIDSSGFASVEPLIVAAEGSAADAIAELRKQLAGGGEVAVNQDGTVLNPLDPQSQTSVANGEGFKPVDKAVVAAMLQQWYELNPQLQKVEVKAMKDIHPDARLSFLPNGQMAWTIRLRPVVCGQRKDWTLLAVYDSDHPQRRWGGSVKIYPVQPNYQEMQQMVRAAGCMPATIPHLLRDSDGQPYLCTQDQSNIHAGHHQGEKVTTAAACLRFAMRWITVFELGLIDPETWSLFQQHGKI